MYKNLSEKLNFGAGLISKSAVETKKLGKKIGSTLKGGEVLALVGDLGSGKTTFVQGLSRGLGIKKRIVSPTFILMRRYELKKKTFYHVDLYRLEENIESEITNLGLNSIWEDKNNIVVIEWADNARKFIPNIANWIYFETVDENNRKIAIKK